MLVFPPRGELRALLTRPFTLAMLGIALLVLLPRVLNLGEVMTVDEPLWRSRAHNFLEAVVTGDLQKTFISGQPGITTLWIAGLALPWDSLRASQTAIAIAVTVFLLMSLGLLRRLAGPAVAIAAGVFIALDPFLIAHSRIVHTDALLGAFMLLTILALILAWRTRQGRYLIYAGIAAALSGLSKLFGFFLLLPAALTIFGAPGQTPAPWLRERISRFARFVAALGITLVVLWPVLVISPETPLAFMTQRATQHFQGAPVGSGGGDTWYYPREFFRRLTPLATVLLPVAAAGLLLGNGRRFPAFPARGALGWLLGTALLYAAILSFGEQKADRYALVTHLAVDIALGSSVVWLALLGQRRRPQTSLARILLPLLIAAGVVLTGDLVRIHPYEIAYWNPLLPVPADAKLGWGEGLEKAAAYLRSLNLPAVELTTASYYPGVLAHFLPDVRVERFPQYESPDFRFVVLYRSMYGRDLGSYETDALKKFLGGAPKDGVTVIVDGTPFRLEKTVYVNRLPYAWIFRRLAG